MRVLSLVAAFAAAALTAWPGFRWGRALRHEPLRFWAVAIGIGIGGVAVMAVAGWYGRDVLAMTALGAMGGLWLGLKWARALPVANPEAPSEPSSSPEAP